MFMQPGPLYHIIISSVKQATAGTTEIHLCPADPRGWSLSQLPTQGPSITHWVQSHTAASELSRFTLLLYCKIKIELT